MNTRRKRILLVVLLVAGTWIVGVQLQRHFGAARPFVDHGSRHEKAVEQLGESCQQLCDTMSALHCEGDAQIPRCKEKCLAYIEDTTVKNCGEQYAAIVKCKVAQPASAWSCQPPGRAELPGRPCAEQSKRWGECLKRLPPAATH